MANNIEELKQAGEILLQAKQEICGILEGTQHQATAVLIGHQLDQLINKVHFLGGNAPIVNESQQFPPITEFMGEPISRAAPITAKELTPDEQERNIFTDKVESLYDAFDQLQTDKILNSYTIPEDALVLRGVAKKAGVKDYATAELNVPFIEAIRQGMADKAAKKQKQDEFEKRLSVDMNDGVVHSVTETIPAADEERESDDDAEWAEPGTTSETTATNRPAPSTGKAKKRK